MAATWLLPMMSLNAIRHGFFHAIFWTYIFWKKKHSMRFPKKGLILPIRVPLQRKPFVFSKKSRNVSHPGSHKHPQLSKEALIHRDPTCRLESANHPGRITWEFSVDFLGGYWWHEPFDRDLSSVSGWWKNGECPASFFWEVRTIDKPGVATIKKRCGNSVSTSGRLWNSYSHELSFKACDDIVRKEWIKQVFAFFDILLAYCLHN